MTKKPTKKDPFQVIYEDNHIIAVNKQSGVLVQGDNTGDTPLSELVKEWLREKYDKPGNVFCGVIHRLDRPVSGLVVLAKTSKGLERMNKVFRDRKVQKTYWAVVKRKPKWEEGKLINWLIKDREKNITTAYRKEVPDGQYAELNFRVLGKLNDHWLMEIKPITGRPHQIRVQLADMGCPIRGDIKYGFPKPNEDGSINLHARNLQFVHPVKKEPLDITAGVPENPFWEQFLTLDDKKIKNKNLDHLY